VTDDVRFAEALAEALGPLYRVSVVGPEGTVEATFGDIPPGRTQGVTIPLPRSSRSLRLEVDTAALAGAERIVRSLASVAGRGPLEPRGAFTHLDGALSELLAMAEVEIGRPLAEMSRADKQRVVRFLDERGAFALRKAVETVADALGVSRFTVYNYLALSREYRSGAQD
jgi:hypothetical protein